MHKDRPAQPNRVRFTAQRHDAVNFDYLALADPDTDSQAVVYTPSRGLEERRPTAKNDHKHQLPVVCTEWFQTRSLIVSVNRPA
eukprot:gene22021-26979_t